MSDLIDVEDAEGNRTQVSAKRLARYPSLAKTFRPVSDQTAVSAVTETPTGEETKEK